MLVRVIVWLAIAAVCVAAVAFTALLLIAFVIS